MCVCVCVYVCMYVCTHSHLFEMYVRAQSFIHTYIYSHIHIYIHIYIQRLILYAICRPRSVLLSWSAHLRRSARGHAVQQTLGAYFVVDGRTDGQDETKTDRCRQEEEVRDTERHMEPKRGRGRDRKGKRE